jgi:Domain of unknown function (DUF2382)
VPNLLLHLREELRVEREPITEANGDDALSGPDLSEEEHEVVLYEERPVVEKQTVPVERVRLDTETVTDQVTISEEVRRCRQLAGRVEEHEARVLRHRTSGADVRGHQNRRLNACRAIRSGGAVDCAALFAPVRPI